MSANFPTSWFARFSMTQQRHRPQLRNRDSPRRSPDELDLWVMTVAQGFAENYPVTHEILSVMKMFAIVEDTQCFLARIDGRVVGGATLAIRGRIAGLFGASTLPEFRNRGVQTALLHARLRSAVEARCELAMSLAQPGSHSQRNITPRLPDPLHQSEIRTRRSRTVGARLQPCLAASRVPHAEFCEGWALGFLSAADSSCRFSLQRLQAPQFQPPQPSVLECRCFFRGSGLQPRQKATQRVGL